jgi:hypothetical protein
MLATYRAVLKGDQLEWVKEAPNLPENQDSVPVIVTIMPELEINLDERRRRVADALAKLAESGAFKGIADPVEWQREIRRDGPLPGREDL